MTSTPFRTLASEYSIDPDACCVLHLRTIDQDNPAKVTRLASQALHRWDRKLATVSRSRNWLLIHLVAELLGCWVAIAGTEQPRSNLAT